MVNVYLLTFNFCRFEWNTYNFYLNGNNNNINSGENFSFNNCIFSHSYNSIFLDSQISGINFNECSFDFNGNHLLINKATNGIINCNGCHFEGVGFSSESVKSDTTPGFGYIIYRNINNKYTCTCVNLRSCFLHLSTYNPAIHLFGNKSENGYNKSLKIKLDSCGISYSSNKLNFDNRYLADEKTEISGTSFNNYQSLIPYQFSSDDNIGKFKKINNDYIGNYVTDKETLNNNFIYLQVNDYSSLPVNLSVDIEDKVFLKSLIIEQKASTTYCNIVRRFYPKKNKVQVTAYVKEKDIETTEENYKMKLIYHLNCKDAKNNLLEIKQSDFIIDNNYLYTKNGWVCATEEFIIPSNCEFADIIASVTFKDNLDKTISWKGSVKCGGIIVTEIDT